MSHTTQVSSKNLLQQISRDRAAGSPFAFRAELPVQPRPAESSGTSKKDSSRKPKQTKRTQVSTKADNLPTVEDCSDEPFISARASKDGLPRYCAQIRRRVDGGPIIISKTFTSLKDAKKWRDDTLAQIQLGLLAPKQKEGSKAAPRVCDLIQKRKDKGRSVEKTATQNLEFWINHPRCQEPASTIDLKWFQNAAEDLLKLEMMPQTAATYMTMLASSLKWAAERDEDVPYDVVVRAMKVLWHDKILARSEERERRPTLDEL